MTYGIELFGRIRGYSASLKLICSSKRATLSVYSIKRVQQIPIPLTTAWDYFSSPANLQAITPAKMGFRVISQHHGEKMYPGQIIEYKVKPLFGIPVYWMTEITQVVDRQFFIDEQRFGPYRMWHHQHHFTEISGGVEMTDIVHYKNPLWVIGDLANAMFVKKTLDDLFNYRYRKIEELFGKWVNHPVM